MVDNPHQHDDGGARPAGDVAGDVLVGATRIAEHIAVLVGEPVDEDNVYYYARVKKWPIGKNGADLVASKRRLNKHADKITRGFDAA